MGAKYKSVTVGIRARFVKDLSIMSSSEIVGEEVRGREANPPTRRGRGGRSKSRDVLAALETTVVKVEVGVADVKE